MNDWYLEWFGEEYSALYAHRDESEARSQIEFVRQVIEPLVPKSALDIGCGNGRHVAALVSGGVPSYGIDASQFSLLRAKKALADITETNCGVVRGDMRRLPFADSSFDLALSMFTTFGYFNSDIEHIEVLKEWRRVLVQAGVLFLDYLNRDYVINNLQPESTKTIGTRSFHEKRSIAADRGRINKDITVVDNSTNEVLTFRESVRMFNLAELTAVARRSGFLLDKTFGDFIGALYSSTSPRLLCVFRKT